VDRAGRDCAILLMRDRGITGARVRGFAELKFAVDMPCRSLAIDVPDDTTVASTSESVATKSTR